MFYFVTDLHGITERYEKLYRQIVVDKPKALLIGGDILPSNPSKYAKSCTFITDYFKPFLLKLKKELAEKYPKIMLILGNDDPKFYEKQILQLEEQSLLNYINNKKLSFAGYDFYGYSYVPVSPFKYKDWEKYDTELKPKLGCKFLNEGVFSVQKTDFDKTIADDLQKLENIANPEKSVFLFHAPPYQTVLDRAGIDNVKVNGQNLDVNIGSKAIKGFLQKTQPLLSLHGHVHESISLTKSWQQKIGSTFVFGAASLPPEFLIVKFDINDLANASQISV